MHPAPTVAVAIPQPRVNYDALRAFAHSYQPPSRARQDTETDTAHVQPRTELDAYLIWEEKIKKGSWENPISISSDSGSSGDGDGDGDGDHDSDPSEKNRNRSRSRTRKRAGIQSRSGLEAEAEGKSESGPKPEPEPEPELESTSPASISSHPPPHLQSRSVYQT